jgi:Tol biopolymer transport system component
MELRLRCLLAGVALTATLMLSGCGGDDSYYYYVPPPPPPGQITEAIAFMAFPDNSHEVWGMEADGSRKTWLAFVAGGRAIQGVFSPDGRKLLFVKQDATSSQIIEQDLLSGAFTELVTDPTSGNNPFAPFYSPDGTKIAYHDDRNGIHVMNSDGTIDLPLPNTTPADTTPSWNSSGTKIVFARGWPLNGSIWVMNPDGSDQIEVQAEDTANGITYWQPKFLPDGRIVCMRESTSLDIVLMNADGSDLVNLTPGTDTTDEFYPSVNIDGNKIAFATDRHGHQDVYVGTLAGTTLTNLVNLTGDVDFDCWRPSFGIALLP